MELKPIPTYSPSKGWYYTEFTSQEEFGEFVKGLFTEMEPDYKFDETSRIFNEEARKFNEKGYYTSAPRGSKDYRTYWRAMKERCKRGIIVHNEKNQTWYLPRYYYHWLNFLKITRKQDGDKQDFADVLDAQYHMALYIQLSLLFYKHCNIFKKRQFAFSYFMASVIYNRYVFDVGFVGKIGASDTQYIDDTGTWKFFNEYRDFNNEYTGWYRPNFPEKTMNWKQQQAIEVTQENGTRKSLYKGTKAKLTGHTFDKKPTAGLGGSISLFFYEEAGIAPTLAKTYGYIKPAMEYGMITTGLFIAGGSVGEISQAQDLYKYLTRPEANGFYAVKSNLIDKSGKEGYTSLFIPEQWAMAPCIDKYGNSQIQEALQMIEEKFKKMEKEMDPADYQLYISQHPRNIEEGFAVRTVSIFPPKHTAKQLRVIENGEYHIKYRELEYNEDKKLVEKETTRLPITDFPVTRTTPDKRGVICIHESPVTGEGGVVPWRSYFASADPVEKGKTETSESLFCIYIYKNPIEITKIDSEGETESFIEGGEIVAWWTGRFDDVNDTNEEARKLIEYYNAYTLCENNKTSLINYLISKNMSKYLVPTKEILFDKEIANEQKVFDKYGWSKSQALWKVMLEYGVNYLSEELHKEEDPNGKILKIIYGVSRIKDIMLIKEMQNYQDKGNYDRIIAYVALIAFVKKQEAEYGIKKLIRRETSASEKKKVYIDRGLHLQSVGRYRQLNYRTGKTFKSIG